MTEALIEALANMDDPEKIQSFLTSLDDNASLLADDSPQTNESTLSDLYNRYLSRRENRSPATRSQYKRTLPKFIEFANSEGIRYPYAITTTLVDEFVDELEGEYDADATVYTYTKNIRAWFQWLNRRNLCNSAICRILDKEELGLSPQVRDVVLPESEATVILENLRNNRYGSSLHTVTELNWNGGPRLGDMHSLDLCDFISGENEIKFRHRPDQGTRLKNGDEFDNSPGDGERNIELKEEVVSAIQYYINNERPDVIDEFDRKPLFTTEQGRASRSTLRRWIYEATSCRWTVDSQEEPSCDGNCDPDSNICPKSYYPHAVRRGAIVNHLSGGLRPDRASERFDVSVKILKKHYDPRTEHKKKEDRAEEVRDAWSEF